MKRVTTPSDWEVLVVSGESEVQKNCLCCFEERDFEYPQVAQTLRGVDYQFDCEVDGAYSATFVQRVYTDNAYKTRKIMRLLTIC